MIIFRYLSRDLLLATLAVSAVLFTIFLTGKFSDYLDDAAQGKLAVDVLFKVIAFRMTGLLELILPLGFYLAILLAYGRMYMDSEMVVLSACGLSQGQIIKMTLIPAAVIATLVALFSFWLSPLGAQLTERTLAEQRNRSEFESLQPGRFQSLGQGNIMAYVESLSDDNRHLQNVFVAHQENSGNHAVIFADGGSQIYKAEYGQRYLVLNQGFRYQGEPGSAAFTITQFKQWGRYLPPTTSAAEITLKSDAKTTAQLFAAQDNESIATLQWRFSMPMMVIIATLLAVPLSKTNPRQGRYLKMLPAILVYVFYLTFLINARSAITKGKLDPELGMWVVHIPFLLVALLIINWPRLTQGSAKRTGSGGSGVAGGQHA